MNQNCLMAIQQYFSKVSNRKFVQTLKAEGYSDAHVFEKVMLISIGSFGIKNVLVTVQTKAPVPRTDLDYHVWVRPLSLETYMVMSGEFKHIDEVYMLVNGGTDFNRPQAELDDTQDW